MKRVSCVEPHVAGCEFVNASGLAPAPTATKIQCQSGWHNVRMSSGLHRAVAAGQRMNENPFRANPPLHLDTQRHGAFISPYRGRV